MLPVIVAGSIGSLNVTVAAMLTDTPVVPLDGVIAMTVGAVVSGTASLRSSALSSLTRRCRRAPRGDLGSPDVRSPPRPRLARHGRSAHIDA